MANQPNESSQPWIPSGDAKSGGPNQDQKFARQVMAKARKMALEERLRASK
jgi:hypothetical protein